MQSYTSHCQTGSSIWTKDIMDTQEYSGYMPSAATLLHHGK